MRLRGCNGAIMQQNFLLVSISWDAHPHFYRILLSQARVSAFFPTTYTGEVRGEKPSIHKYFDFLLILYLFLLSGTFLQVLLIVRVVRPPFRLGVENMGKKRLIVLLSEYNLRQYFHNFFVYFCIRFFKFAFLRLSPFFISSRMVEIKFTILPFLAMTQLFWLNLKTRYLISNLTSKLG